MSGSLVSEERLVVFAGVDARLVAPLSAAFASAGFSTLCSSRERLCAAVDGRRVSAVVLDASDGVVGAVELCRQLADIPVVALASDEVDARIALLEAGADDCVSKPFAPRELVARVETIERRRSRNGNGARLVTYADLHVDLAAHRVWRGHREVILTRTEFALLATLAARPEQVCARRDLLIEVWGYDFGPEFHSPAVYVGYLRKKLEEAGEPRLIQTVRGVGYVLRAT